jgi:hypothetical protein
MFRGAAAALQPNWLSLPVAYHGRASSIEVGTAGHDVRRPRGQIQKDKTDPSQVCASRFSKATCAITIVKLTLLDMCIHNIRTLELQLDAVTMHTLYLELTLTTSAVSMTARASLNASLP